MGDSISTAQINKYSTDQRLQPARKRRKKARIARSSQGRSARRRSLFRVPTPLLLVLLRRSSSYWLICLTPWRPGLQMTACEVWFGIAAFMENTCTLSGAQSSLLSMYSLFASSVLQINPRTEEGRKTEL